MGDSLIRVPHRLQPTKSGPRRSARGSSRRRFSLCLSAAVFGRPSIKLRGSSAGETTRQVRVENTCLDESGGVRDGGMAHPGLCRTALSLELCNGREFFGFVRGPSKLEA